MQHFEGYDPEGFSMWFCEYKYPEENTVNFIVMNKVGHVCASTRMCMQLCVRTYKDKGLSIPPHACMCLALRVCILKLCGCFTAHGRKHACLSHLIMAILTWVFLNPI